MISIFKKNDTTFYLVGSSNSLSDQDISKLNWLLGNAEKVDAESITGSFIGPRKEMLTPWSTNAVEITQNMGISGIDRIEEFTTDGDYDPMLTQKYEVLDQSTFTIDKAPEEIHRLQSNV